MARNLATSEERAALAKALRSGEPSAADAVRPFAAGLTLTAGDELLSAACMAKGEHSLSNLEALLDMGLDAERPSELLGAAIGVGNEDTSRLLISRGVTLGDVRQSDGAEVSDSEGYHGHSSYTQAATKVGFKLALKLFLEGALSKSDVIGMSREALLLAHSSDVDRWRRDEAKSAFYADAAKRLLRTLEEQGEDLSFLDALVTARTSPVVIGVIGEICPQSLNRKYSQAFLRTAPDRFAAMAPYMDLTLVKQKPRAILMLAEYGDAMKIEGVVNTWKGQLKKEDLYKAIDRATEVGNTEMVSFLLDRGASLVSTGDDENALLL